MLRVAHVSVSYDTQPVLSDIDLTIEQGEIICLLGASGSGKTTLLRMIAGLQAAERGDVLLDGRSILRLPVHQRGFGLMFQDFALFPHLNVGQNVAFGLRMANMPIRQQQTRMREVLALVGLSGYEVRDVSSLSGGEKQRVALARSLAPNPRLLMLDEPLGALDALLRDRLVVELRAIIKRLGLAAIYVTHDQSEAFAIADRIALLHEGTIEQFDTPETFYRQPRTVYAARFFGLTNIIPVQKIDAGQAHTPIGIFPAEDGAAHLLLHPDGLRFVSPDDEGAIRGEVVERVFQGDGYRLRVKVAGDHTLTFTHPARDDAAPEVGAQVGVTVSGKGITPISS